MAKRNDVWKPQSDMLPQPPKKIEDEPLGIEAEVAFCESLNLREAPSKSAPVISILPKSATLVIISLIDEWARIRVADSEKFGYVMRKFIKEI